MHRRDTTRSPRWIQSVIVLPLVLGFLACGSGGGGGGGNGDPPTGPNPGGPAPLLDYSALQGTWSGWARADDGEILWLRWTFQANARAGEGVAESNLGTESDGELVIECDGQLIAREAEPPDYMVHYDNDNGACINGVVTLDHDPVAQTLFHTFEAFNGTLSAEGTLTPGADPGPPPAGGIPDVDD